MFLQKMSKSSGSEMLFTAFSTGYLVKDQSRSSLSLLLELAAIFPNVHL